MILIFGIVEALFWRNLTQIGRNDAKVRFVNPDESKWDKKGLPSGLSSAKLGTKTR